jgi:hypothetical protein
MSGFENLMSGMAAGADLMLRQAAIGLAGAALVGAVLLTAAWALAGILKPTR